LIPEKNKKVRRILIMMVLFGIKYFFLFPQTNYTIKMVCMLGNIGFFTNTAFSLSEQPQLSSSGSQLNDKSSRI
jgi:hypothetical protein